MTPLPKVTNTYIQQEAPSELLCAIERQIARLRLLYDGPDSHYLAPESREIGLRRVSALEALIDTDNLYKWIPGFIKAINETFPELDESSEAEQGDLA